MTFIPDTSEGDPFDDMALQAQKYVGQTLPDGGKILSLIGIGGMAAVYKVLMPVKAAKEGGKEVALKMLHQKYAADPDQVRRVKREFLVLAGLNHPNLVTVEGDGVTHDGRYYYCMPLLEGKSLDRVVDDEHEQARFLSWRRWCQWGISIAEGMQYAHKNGVIHRDLKPQNIFLSKSGRVHEHIRVMDFGLVQVRQAKGRQVTRLTMASAQFGTPAYMSPEQCMDAGGVDGRSDIYALGCIFYEFATGRVPFEGESGGEIMLQHMGVPVKPVMGYIVDPTFPQALASLIEKMLAKNPADRVQTMEEVVIALANILGLTIGEGDAPIESRITIPRGSDDETVEEAMVSPVPKAPDQHLSVAPAITSHPKTVPLPGNRRRLMVVGGATLLGLLAALGVRSLLVSSDPVHSSTPRLTTRSVEPPSPVVPAPVPAPEPVRAPITEPPTPPPPVLAPPVAPVAVVPPVRTRVRRPPRHGRQCNDEYGFEVPCATLHRH